ncbi:type II secretion system protein GspL [Pseudomonas sp. NPDC089554]|uniref:type II secretion system protein GspL n=1 Tax=Pseudomonas sp. NPDC089554 TaxID=3390653 RepID=UPI003CFF4022
MNGQLRVRLPRLDALDDATLDYLLLDRQGKLEGQGRAMPSELAQLARSRLLVAWLHPDDAVQATLELPPLPANRLGDAVRCAAQGLVLGDIEQLHIAHGPREANGQVSVAWVSQAGLQALMAWSQRVGLRWRALHPAPPPGEEIQALPRWGLQSAVKRNEGDARGWRRAAACVGLAVAVWVIGLNLHASRLADEGQTLRQRMHQQVRQAFPQLPVIINPLQQVRQQLQAGSAQGQADGSFQGLVLAAGGAMPFLAGSLQALDYSGDGLELELAEDARQAPTDLTWQATLTGQGIEAQATAEGWRLRAATQVTGTQEVANVQ